LGGVVAAVFTAWSIQQIPPVEWGFKFLQEVLPKCVEYLKKTKRDMDKYTEEKNLTYFSDAWTNYLKSRNLLSKNPTLTFPDPYGVEEREKFYKDISFSGWGGSSGHDSVIIVS
jgi:ADP-ribosylarginine hydrolase